MADHRNLSDATEKAQEFNAFFASQCSAPADESFTADHILPKVQCKMNEFKISEAEIMSILQKLNTKKANGPDNISNTILKSTAPSICPSLTKLINKSLSMKQFPTQWKCANVVPVHKKNSKQEVKNYRPISLLSNISKVMEKAIYNRLYMYLVRNNLLTWRNSGFRRSDGTVYQLVNIVHEIYHDLDNGSENCMVFLDASKAFDKVWHRGLLYKLLQIGINSNLSEWFGSYLKGRKIRTVVEGKQSPWLNIFASVPQGSILGPLLFLIFVNDIVDNVQSNIYLFADDTSLTQKIEKSNPTRAFTILNEDLQTLEKWAKLWHVTFNAEKSEYVIFSHHHKPYYPQLYMNNEPLKKATSHKHLGLILDERLRWNDHINFIINTSNKLVGTIWKLGHQIPRYCLENYYKSFIRPRLEYASVCFDNITAQQAILLEKSQRKAAIACTRAYQRTPNRLLLHELGWPTLEQRRHYSKLALVYKIIKGNAPQYLQEIMPPSHGETYGLQRTRSSNKLQLPVARTEIFRKSFVPSSAKAWNALTNELREVTSLTCFKYQLKNSLFPKHTKYHSIGYGNAAVNHSRLRMGLSALKSQRADYHLITDRRCDRCYAPNEDVNHYFHECPCYSAIRRTLTLEVELLLAPLGITMSTDTVNKRTVFSNLLLRGSHLIVNETNIALMKICQKYIKASKRF